MVDSLQIPKDITKIVEVSVKDTSEPLRKFILNQVQLINALEKRIASLEARVSILESP